MATQDDPLTKIAELSLSMHRSPRPTARGARSTLIGRASCPLLRHTLPPVGGQQKGALQINNAIQSLPADEIAGAARGDAGSAKMSRAWTITNIWACSCSASSMPGGTGPIIGRRPGTAPIPYCRPPWPAAIRDWCCARSAANDRASAPRH